MTEEMKDKMILVRAVRLGIYADQRRFPKTSNHPRAGQSFWVKESELSDCEKKVGKSGLYGWMQKVNPDAPIIATPEVAPAQVVKNETKKITPLQAAKGEDHAPPPPTNPEIQDLNVI